MHHACRQARQQLGRDLDLFVMNSVGSLAQCVFVILLLPAMTSLRGMSLRDLPGYVVQGMLRGPAVCQRVCVQPFYHGRARTGWQGLLLGSFCR